MRINARGMSYRDLDAEIYHAVNDGIKEIVIDNVNGQRYIGAGLKGDIRITINGVPGNDLAAFMDGPTIVVNANGQDGIGNTMNGGRIIIHGNAGDIVGYSMRSGKIFIKGDAGYRVGIHMKSYRDFYPVIIVGGRVQDFLGEYMAGGLIIVLGLGQKASPVAGNFCGTGMHGGIIYLREEVEDWQLGQEVKKYSLNNKDAQFIKSYLNEYCSYFFLEQEEVMKEEFVKLVPHTHRPYGNLYAY